MNNLTRKKYVAIHSYDPCYGMKIIKKGSIIEVTEEIGSHSLCNCRIVSVDGVEYGGFGMGFYKDTLAEYFKAL